MSSDLPAQGLYQQLHARRVSGEHLEVLGKTASERYLEGRYKTLTEAVTQTVKQAQLSPEQVQRVTEFANTSTFQETFRKEGAGHRVVEFPGGPADPSLILKDLNDGGGGTVFDRGMADYDYAPEKRAADASVEEAVKLAFAAPNPSPEYSFAEPLEEAYEAKDKLASAQELLTGELSTLENMYSDLTERIYHEVKQAALSGTTLGDVIHAWSTVEGATPTHVKIAFEFIGPRLIKDEVFRSGGVQASLEKVGSVRRLVNPEHPLVVDFGEFCTTLSKLAQVRAARTEISQNLAVIDSFLKQAASGIIPKIYEHSGKAGRVAGKGAEQAARFLLGSGHPHAGTVGKVVGKVVEHAPTIGAVVAGNEVRRHLKYSPVFQGAKDTALQFVPGTPQYQQREYQLAAGSMGYPQGY